MALCMPKDLSEEADRLLAGTSRDSEMPAYRERDFVRRTRLAQKRSKRHEQLHGVTAEERDQITSKLLCEILDRAGLSEAQREVVELRRQGMGWSEIGQKRGHSKQAAKQNFERAWPKVLQAATEFTAYQDLSQVYAAEVRERLQFLGEVDND